MRADVQKLHKSTFKITLYLMLFCVVGISATLYLISELDQLNVKDTYILFIILIIQVRMTFLAILIIIDLILIKDIYQDYFSIINTPFKLLFSMIRLDEHQLVNIIISYTLIYCFYQLIYNQDLLLLNQTCIYFEYGFMLLLFVFLITLRITNSMFPFYKYTLRNSKRKKCCIVFIYFMIVLNTIRIVIFTLITNYNETKDLIVFSLAIITVLSTDIILFKVMKKIRNIEVDNVDSQTYQFNGWCTLFLCKMNTENMKYRKLLLYILFFGYGLALQILSENSYTLFELRFIQIALIDVFLQKTFCTCFRNLRSEQNFSGENQAERPQIAIGSNEDENQRILIQCLSEEEENKFMQSHKDAECPICLDKLEHKLAQLSCLHMFHKDCIEKWQQINKYCPLCRKQLVQNL